MFEWLQLGRLAQSGLYSQGKCKPLCMMAQINNKAIQQAMAMFEIPKRQSPHPLARHPTPIRASWPSIAILSMAAVYASLKCGGGRGSPTCITHRQYNKGNQNCNTYFLQPGSNSFVSIPVLLKKCPGPFSWSSSMFIWNRSIRMTVLMNVELVFQLPGASLR